MSYSDGEEGWDGLADLPHDVSHAALGSTERNVKRRTSKACDHCRKSKCKCERPNPKEPCKNCIDTGTSCTFLGPSRKRGPPKGYIDAIEARLHQTEALLGIMLATTDGRAKSLLDDIAQDPLAKEIINRVDNSPYGVRGRTGEYVAVSVSKEGSTPVQGTETSSTGQANPDPLPDLRTMHPSNEWQDRVVGMINGRPSSLPQPLQDYHSPKSEVSEDSISHTRKRQRRRVGTEDHPLRAALQVSKSPSAPPLHEARSSTSSWYQTPSPGWAFPESGSADKIDRRSKSIGSEALDSGSEEELLSAVGQLSINEDEQIRYHGKASGIYLLRKKERLDQRNEGDIWRFPKARVWPRLPSMSPSLNDSDLGIELPPKEVQEHLLDLYFAYVQPYLPIIHKQSFLAAFRDEPQVHTESPSDQPADPINPAVHGRRRDIPVLLLLAMFACASRHDTIITPLPSDPSIMWPAGDEYLERAKIVLNSTYASSRPATVQALLLMAYREGGIGDMSLAWTYVGMGIRMAQDLGMHRLADGWKRSDLGGRLFNEWELAERKRIWFGCVVLDKYISAIIGRPLMIFESDFDTVLPSVDDLEENEDWSVEMALGEYSSPAPGRMISCFNAIAVLFGIFGKVMQSLYAVRPAGSRQTEASILESALDKWYLDLPEHLRCELVNTGSSFSVPLSSKQRKPLPNVLVLHMHYWTTVLILHRPFIAHLLHRKEKHADHEDLEIRSKISRSYELCRTAAIHVASLAWLYQETYLFQRCSPLLTYCLFSSSILLDADMARHPDDPQARSSFSKSISGLNAMGVVWPSAGRALALFTGAKSGVVDNSLVELIQSSTTREGSKRAAEEELDESSDRRTSDTNKIARPPPNRIPQFAPKPRTSVPNLGNIQHRFSHPHQGRSPPGGIFTGGQPYIATPIPSPSSDLIPEFVDPGYMQEANEFGDQLTTAVIPHLYSSGFLDDLEGSIYGMQPLPAQDFQIYRGGAFLPQSHSHPPPQVVSQLGHYEMQGAVPLFSPHSQTPHNFYPYQQRQHPRMGTIRPITHRQEHSDIYPPHRFDLYTTYRT